MTHFTHTTQANTQRIAITLPGGCSATVVFRDQDEDGDIEMDVAFAGAHHAHTRQDAITSAERIAPHVTEWNIVTA
jgi:L-aminopeptidase/D-esterase-like protein